MREMEAVTNWISACLPTSGADMRDGHGEGEGEGESESESGDEVKL